MLLLSIDIGSVNTVLVLISTDGNDFQFIQYIEVCAVLKMSLNKLTRLKRTLDNLLKLYKIDKCLIETQMSGYEGTSNYSQKNNKFIEGFLFGYFATTEFDVVQVSAKYRLSY